MNKHSEELADSFKQNQAIARLHMAAVGVPLQHTVRTGGQASGDSNLACLPIGYFCTLSAQFSDRRTVDYGRRVSTRSGRWCKLGGRCFGEDHLRPLEGAAPEIAGTPSKGTHLQKKTLILIGS